MDDEKRICETCGSPITRTYGNRPSRFCSRPCYWETTRSIRKATTKIGRMRKVPDHPLAPPSGTVFECRLVLYNKIGAGLQICHWCGTTLRWRPGKGNARDAVVADHLDWDRDNNDPANLVPSCRVCNAHRVRGGGRSLIKEDELTVQTPGTNRTRAVQRICVVCGDSFLAAIAQVKTGRGLYCSRSCARKGPKKPRRQPSSS